MSYDGETWDAYDQLILCRPTDEYGDDSGYDDAACTGNCGFQMLKGRMLGNMGRGFSGLRVSNAESASVRPSDHCLSLPPQRFTIPAA